MDYRRGKLPIPTGERIRAHDGAAYLIYTDGSHRRDPAKTRGNGKARRRAVIRARRANAG